MNKDKTLVILMPGFAKDENDTTCIPFSQSFIRTLARLYPSFCIIILTLDHPYHSTPYKWNGIDVIPFNGNRYKHFRPLLWIKVYNELKRISKRKYLAGVLSFWCAENALIAHYFSKWNSCKHFIWLQGQDARKGNGAMRFFKPSSKELVALSDFLSDEFHRNYSIRPCKTIYPGIDENDFSVLDDERSIDIIGVGSLIPLKQYEVFADVVKQLKQHFPNIQAVLIGVGSEAESLQNLISKNDLEATIHLKGKLDRSEVLSSMSKAKILLHPSSYEGYGMVCLEALYAGCHVISFVQPEKKEIEKWYIVKSKNEMIEKCIYLLQQKIDGKRVKPCGIEHTVQQVMDLYT